MRRSRGAPGIEGARDFPGAGSFFSKGFGASEIKRQSRAFLGRDEKTFKTFYFRGEPSIKGRREGAKKTRQKIGTFKKSSNPFRNHCRCRRESRIRCRSGGNSLDVRGGKAGAALRMTLRRF